MVTILVTICHFYPMKVIDRLIQQCSSTQHKPCRTKECGMAGISQAILHFDQQESNREKATTICNLHISLLHTYVAT